MSAKNISAKKAREARPAEKIEPKTKWSVERGSATVKIYLTPHGAEKYYTISYWTDGKRKRQVFPTLQQAKDVAAEKATQMTHGDLGVAKLTNADSAAYLRATALLQPVGASLEFAASEYASAVKRLGAVSFSQAVDFYLKRHPVHLAPKMVREVVDELLKIKESDELSIRYRKQLEYDLNRFAGRFRGRIGDVAGTDIDAWLRDLEVGPRTRNNLRNSVQALFNFAISRKYLPKDHDELDAVPVAKDVDGEIEILRRKKWRTYWLWHHWSIFRSSPSARLRGCATPNCSASIGRTSSERLASSRSDLGQRRRRAGGSSRYCRTCGSGWREIGGNPARFAPTRTWWSSSWNWLSG